MPNDIKCDDSLTSQHTPSSITGFYQSMDNTKLSLVTLEMPMSFSAENSFFSKTLFISYEQKQIENSDDRQISLSDPYTVGWSMEIDKIGPQLNSKKIKSLTHKKLSAFEYYSDAYFTRTAQILFHRIRHST